jgi:hypothetical protein
MKLPSNLGFSFMLVAALVFYDGAPLTHAAMPVSPVLEKAIQYFDWLENHTAYFAQCKPVRNGEYYELCDKTRVIRNELQLLFSKKPAELLSWIRGQGLRVEVLCDSSKSDQDAFAEGCQSQSARKGFAELSALHGKYLPEEKTVLIRSSASPGSLIHEYLHSRQANNQNAVFGKVYKATRLQIQLGLTQTMDEQIEIVKRLDASGRGQEAIGHVKVFNIASELMRSFGPWQDLIDERSIFQLYLSYGSEFGARKEDLDLARKNMGFICRNPKLKEVLSSEQCPSI